MVNDSLKDRILEEAVKNLCFDHQYFAYPLSLLSPSFSHSVKSVATDGNGTYFNGDYILYLTAKYGVGEVSSALLHCLLHVLFLHPFIGEKEDELFDLACDIVVGFSLDEMSIPFGDTSAVVKRKAVYKSIIDGFGGVNDKSAYEYAKKNAEDKEKLTGLFKICDHSLWKGADGNKDDEDTDDTDEKDKEFWIDVIKEITPKIGNENKTLYYKLKGITGGDGDYRELIKKFLDLRERIKNNDDEFDYVYYCFGLSLYKNVPLIENLEYVEDKGNSSFVVAIDTSGSTQGEPVKRFLREVFTLIYQAGETAKNIKVTVLQCDDKLRSVTEIKSSADIEQKLSDYELIGGGGTDFRPVFDYADKMVKDGENVKGVIYFTDGYGVFKKETPTYKTCFAVYNDYERKVDVPHYALRIDVSEGDLL